MKLFPLRDYSFELRYLFGVFMPGGEVTALNLQTVASSLQARDVPTSGTAPFSRRITDDMASSYFSNDSPVREKSVLS